MSVCRRRDCKERHIDNLHDSRKTDRAHFGTQQQKEEGRQLVSKDIEAVETAVGKMSLDSTNVSGRDLEIGNERSQYLSRNGETGLSDVSGTVRNQAFSTSRQ